MKRPVLLALVGVIVIGTLLFLLAGCSVQAGSGNGGEYTGNRIEVATVDVGDREVTCIVYRGNGGISCDW